MLAIGAFAQPYPGPKFCNFFDSASTLNGQLAPVGSIIKAYDPQGVLVGVDTFGFGPTAPAGYYGFMPVYGDDPDTPELDEGAVALDTIHFTINDRLATVVSGNPAWADQGERKLRLAANATIALSLLHAPADTLATIDRVIRFYVTVQNDGDGLDNYFVRASNDNADFSTVAEASFVYANAGDSAVLYFDIHTPIFAADTVDNVTYRVYSQLDTTKSVSGVVQLNMSITDVNDGRHSLPSGFALLQNYPNPFNPSTTISFSLPRGSRVQLDVFDVLGRSIDSRDLRNLSAGDHSISYNASTLASGVYFYRVTTQFGAQSRKMMLLK